MYYYEIAPLKIVRATSQTFTYMSPEPLALGQLVVVSVGQSLLTGVVMSATKKPSYTVKTIGEALPLPALPIALIDTATWISRYYRTHLATVLQTVLPAGVSKNRRTKKSAEPYPKRNRTNFLLTQEQSAAIQKINKSTPGTIIVRGVTGSGKTAVYIELAKQSLAQGRSIIILVPEIALSSQLVAEFNNFFDDIIIAHSEQTEAERYWSWYDALTSTKPRVVIGPRSALFSPLTSIAHIVIDESHEPSYKQDASPRYSALRVASILASHHQAKVIQGSATPSINEFYIAKSMDRPIIEMSSRARSDAIPPQIKLIDMTKKNNHTQHRFFSDDLLKTIKQTTDNHHQVLIFHNRRGSANITLCTHCGWSALCPRCLVPLTLHTDTYLLKCHICGFKTHVPTSCPQCHSTDIIHKGIGTKLIESEIRRLFPTKTVMRFDGDSSLNNKLNKKYQELYDNKVDIIVGTQVVAKGLDLPHLRAVGVIQADNGLSLPDYGADERTFQLLSQVIGRVGRDKHNSTVIVQSYQPHHPAIKYGIAQDYPSFYSYAIAQRRKAGFPPFCYILRLTCIYKTEAIAIKHAQQFSTKLKELFPDIIINGPTPSFYEYLNGTYRWQIIAKSPKRARLLLLLDYLPPAHWQFDIDPLSLL